MELRATLHHRFPIAPGLLAAFIVCVYGLMVPSLADEPEAAIQPLLLGQGDDLSGTPDPLTLWPDDSMPPQPESTPPLTSSAKESKDAASKSKDAASKSKDEPSESKDKAKKTPDKKCDEKKKKELAKAVATAYKGVFYDNDFSYLLDPCYEGWQLGDLLKRRSIGPNTTWDVGGQYRFRFQDEQNFRGLGLTGLDDDFLLQRTRLFINGQWGTRFRVYAEYLDAVSTNESLAPRLIEENRSEMLNLFADSVLLDTGEGKLTARAGRQELLYADERLLSPLDWANIRRTFDGGRLIWKTKKLETNAIWVMPLSIVPTRFDGPNRNQQLYGLYSSYFASETDTVDAFYLAFDDDVTGRRVDGIGGRVYRQHGQFLSELWGDYQFGENADDTAHQAGAWTFGIGRNLPGAWKPNLWVYYDWASGGHRQGAGDGHFQFFPLAHKYFGYMDFFGRSNIESPNVRLTMDPSEKLQILVWYYYLFLEDRRDTPYTVQMTPFFPGVTPAAAELGHELDLLATYKLGPRASLLGGYSHFFSGAYYDTPGLPFSGDADFLYLQYQLSF